MKSCRRSARRATISSLLLTVLLLGVCLQSAPAAETMNDVMRAFNEVASKGDGASEAAKALAFKHNNVLHTLKYNEKIPESTFQANQSVFKKTNERLIQTAAGNNKLSYKAQKAKPGKTSTPGADTDGIVGSPDPKKPITAKQVSNARSDYKKAVKEYLNNNGCGEGPIPDTNTSIMPDPNSMKKEEWQKAIDEADRAGEVVYKDPKAASAEAKIRDGKPITMGEANARVNEVRRLAKEHFAAADQLDDMARNAPPGPQREALEAQAQIARHNGAKQLNRINETGQYVAQQNGIKNPAGGGPGETMGTAEVRNLGNRKEAAAASALADQYVVKATESYVKNLADVAKNSKNPGTIAAAEQNMAKAINALPPAQQGQMIESLRNTNPQMARNVAKNMRTLPKPKPTAPGTSRVGKAMKVLGPIMIIYDGANRLNDVRKADDPSHEAGKQLGGFTGGTAGGVAGGVAGAKLGGAIGTAICPGVGTTIGAIGGAIIGGYIGYTAGSAKGAEMGDTNSKYWDKNKSQEEFNKLAMKGTLDPNRDVFGQLRAMGVSRVDAYAAADAYKSGSLKSFRDKLKEIRENMIKSGQWKRKGFRRFKDVPDDERQRLLDCLCSASLGANPWVAQGYNTTLPENPQPDKYSCDSLANGPCMAQGFGCWRSFINLHSEAAKECFESAGLQHAPWNIAQVNSEYQQEYEEPFNIDFEVSPLQVCPGDRVSVKCRPTGGQGGYQMNYEWGHILLAGDSPPTTESQSFTLTVDPGLKREIVDGRSVNTRSWEAYNSYVRVVAYANTIVGGEQRQHRMIKTMTVTLRRHDECEKLKPPKKEEAKEKAVAPVKKGSRATTSGTSGSAPDTSTSEPDQQGPSGGGPAITSAGGSRGGDKESKSKKDTKDEKGRRKKRSWGKKDSGHEKDDDYVDIVPDKPGKKKTAGGDDSDCGFSMGGACESEDGPASIFASGPPGQRIRMTITGSDGFSETIEGTGQIGISRPLNRNGSDKIVLENLDKPECREEITNNYDENGAPIMDDGLQSAEPALPPMSGEAADNTVDIFSDGKQAESDRRTSEGMAGMDAAGKLDAASHVGDEKLGQARGIVDTAGSQAKATRDKSAQDTAAKDAENSWGKVLGDSLEKGITEGLTSFGSSFGSAAGQQVGSEIFDSGGKKEVSTGEPEDEGEAESTQVSGSTPKKSSGSSGKSSKSGKKDKKDKEHDDHEEMDSATCGYCGYVMKFPLGGRPPASCPKCGCGEGKDLCTCSVCGHEWFVSAGNPTPCPNCSKGTKIEEDTSPDEPRNTESSGSTSSDSGYDSDSSDSSDSNTGP